MHPYYRHNEDVPQQLCYELEALKAETERLRRLELKEQHGGKYRSRLCQLRLSIRSLENEIRRRANIPPGRRGEIKYKCSPFAQAIEEMDKRWHKDEEAGWTNAGNLQRLEKVAFGGQNRKNPQKMKQGKGHVAHSSAQGTSHGMPHETNHGFIGMPQKESYPITQGKSRAIPREKRHKLAHKQSHEKTERTIPEVDLSKYRRKSDVERKLDTLKEKSSSKMQRLEREYASKLEKEQARLKQQLQREEEAHLRAEEKRHERVLATRLGKEKKKVSMAKKLETQSRRYAERLQEALHKTDKETAKLKKEKNWIDSEWNEKLQEKEEELNELHRENKERNRREKKKAREENEEAARLKEKLKKKDIEMKRLQAEKTKATKQLRTELKAEKERTRKMEKEAKLRKLKQKEKERQREEQRSKSKKKKSKSGYTGASSVSTSPEPESGSDDGEDYDRNGVITEKDIRSAFDEVDEDEYVFPFSFFLSDVHDF